MSDVRLREDIRSVPYRPAPDAPGLEIQRRSDLIARFPASHFDEVERLHFHLMVLGNAGTGTHEVDFVEVELRPNRLLHVEPGQVHRWRLDPEIDATLLLVEELPIRLDPRSSLGPSIIDYSPDERRAIDAVLELFDEEQRLDRDPRSTGIALRSLRDLLVVRLRLNQARMTGDDLPAPYVALRRDLEADLSVATTLEARAARLGYATRTLSRACNEVVGRSAKQVVDERVVLEAKRLLSQSGTTVSQVARTIGFSEPTNFAKYFRRQTSLTPTDWIASIR